MRKTKNADLITEATELVNDLEYIQHKAPYIVEQLKNTVFTKKEKEENNIYYLIDSLELC